MEAAIARAFSAKDPITPTDLVYGHAWNDEDIVHDFNNISDADTSDAFIQRHKDALANFAPEGFLWALPRYMSYSIRFPNSEVADFVIYHLANRKDSEPYWLARVAVLSGDHRNAICEFLTFMMKIHKGDDDALKDALRTWCDQYPFVAT